MFVERDMRPAVDARVNEFEVSLKWIEGRTNGDRASGRTGIPGGDLEHPGKPRNRSFRVSGRC